VKYKQLTEIERYQIYTLLKAGFNQKQISEALNRAASTISRELKRNHGLRGYRPAQAQRLSDSRRVNAAKFVKITDEVYGWIVQLIEKDLSPEQVADYLAKHRNVSLHHETIYQLIYEDKQSGGTLYKHLRIVSKAYRKRYGSYDNRGKIKGRVSIDERPEVVDRRNRLGDWEGDTIIGKGRKSAMLTMVERKSLFTVIVKLEGKRADLLADALIEKMSPMASKIKTITFDNGLEFAEHGLIASALDTRVFFAHPYSSWERGINENTNGLIRQYFPKGADLNRVTDEQISFVMDRLNNRPRKTRGGKTPNEIFLGQRVDLLAA
jgi:IS30 family transposase